MLRVKVSLTEMLHNLRNGLRDTWKIQFMVLCKLGCIVDQYNIKSEYPDNIWWKFHVTSSTKSVKLFMGRGKFHL
jgi:hypothetical protein